MINLKIQSGGHGRNTKVWMDGVEIGQHLTDLKIDICVAEAVKAQMTVLVADLDIKSLAIPEFLEHYIHRPRPSFRTQFLALLKHVRQWAERSLVSPNQRA